MLQIRDLCPICNIPLTDISCFVDGTKRVEYACNACIQKSSHDVIIHNSLGLTSFPTTYISYRDSYDVYLAHECVTFPNINSSFGIFYRTTYIQIIEYNIKKHFDDPFSNSECNKYSIGYKIKNNPELMDLKLMERFFNQKAFLDRLKIF